MGSPEDASDALLIVIPDFLYLYSMDEWDISPEISEAADSFRDRPIVLSIFGPRGPLTAKLEDIENVVVYPSCERGVRALSRMRQYAEWLSHQETSE